MSGESGERNPKQRRVLAGGALIVLGLTLFLLQLVEGPSETVIFFLAGGAFLAGYFYRRVYGFLIAGCILLGLGVGSVGARSAIAVHNFGTLALGAAFVAIYIIDLLYRGRSSWWPLVPGIILIVTAVASGSARFGRFLSNGWPLILVVIGVLVLLNAVERGPREPR